MTLSTLHNAISVVAVIALLSGCATSSSVLSRKGVDDADQAARRELVKSQYIAPDVPSGPLRERNGLYLAGATTENSHGSTGLPAKYRKSYAFVAADPLDFRAVSALITRQTGLPVIARAPQSAGAAGPAAAQSGSSADIATAKMAAGPRPPGFDTEKALAAANQTIAASASAAQPGLANVTAGTMSVNFSGSLDSFLDLVGDSFGYGWTYEDGRIVFAHTQVETFDIPALPIVMHLAFALDSGAQTGAAGGSSGGIQQTGGSSQKAATDAAFNLWTEIEKTIKSIVGNDGTVDISGSTGTVTVNASAPTVRQVKFYVARINKELSREVVLAVDVYSVTLAKGDNYQVDLNLAFAQGTKWGAGYGSTGAQSSVTTVSSLISNATSSSNGIGFAILDSNSKFNGTNGLIEALSTQGDVAVVNSANLTTLNGIPAPFQVVNTRGYVAQVSTTTTGSAGQSTGSVQTSLTPSSVTTGFNLYVVPRVDRNGSVLLQYGVNISELVGATNGFDTFTSGGQTVQLPNINARNFVQEAAVPVGGTLVLTGFEQKNDKINDQGPIDSSLWPLGGQKINSHGRTVVVVSISPRIIAFGQHNAVD